MLTKKDKKKRYNKKAKTSSTHVFDAWGDRYDSNFMKNSANIAQEALSGSNLGKSIASITGGIGGIVEAGMANAQIANTTEQRQEAENRANWQSSASDSNNLLNEMASDVQLNENIDWRSIRGSNGWQQAGNILKGAISGASTGAQVGGGLGAIAGVGTAVATGLAGLFIGNNKARTESAALGQLNKNSNLAKAQTFTSKAASLDQQQDAAAQRAYAAYGGDINASKFPDYPSKVTEFNAGGSHEENPYDGIPQGIAPDGLPNLVEEGEVKFDNYIFSDRLMLNKNDKKKYKFLKGKTYADAAKAIKKELGIDERPNDVIAKTDLEEQLNLLSILQEEKRAKRGLKGENRMMYAKGGHLFAGLSDDMHPIWEDILPSKPLFSVSPISKEVLSASSPSFKEIDKFDYNRIPKFNKSGEVITDEYGEKQFSRINPTDNDYRPIVLGSQAQIDKGMQNSVRPLALDSLNLSKSNRPSFTPKKSQTTNTGNWESSLSQAMPAIGSAIGTMASIFEEPNYEHTNRLIQPEKSVTPITYTPTHQDIRLPRLDKNFYMNKMDAQAAATRRAIREQTASNPYASTSHLLVADAQGNATRGDIRRQGEEMEINRILQEAQFNSTGRRADAEGFLKADSANASLLDKALTRQAEKDIYAARLNMAEDQAHDAAKSANLTSLFDNLGAIGKEKKEFALAAIRALGEGKMTPEQLAVYASQFPEIGKYLGYKGKYGGKLRRKKGYTI